MTPDSPEMNPELTIPMLTYATRQLASESDINRIIQIALDTLSNFGKSERIALVNLDREKSGSNGKLVGLLKGGEISMPNNPIRVDISPFKQVIETKKPGIYPTGSGTPCLCLPLVGLQNQVTGAVVLDRANDSPLPNNEMQVMVILATLIAVAFEQNHYFKLATFDALTGLYMRRHFEIRLREESARLQRHGGELSVIMADIDNFKKINDTYGHPQGDTVLRELASILRYSIRKDVDIPCRFGGEEFAVILPYTGKAGALVVAERFRQNCADYPFSGQDKPLKVTISGGVMGLVQADMETITIEEIIKRADFKLYEAKTAGRNKVLAWD